MAKARSIDAKLARLKVLRNEPPSPQLTAELRTLLADPSNFVVAEAARLVSEADSAALTPDLLIAFERFLIDPVKTDKLCLAKIAILDALNRLEYGDSTIYEKNVTYTQEEPVWGGSEDRAADLRAACAFGLVRTAGLKSLPLLADLLVDKEKATRVAAAMALAGAMETAALPLLRLKVRVGDKEPEVISACFTSLIILNPDTSLPFVAEFLTLGQGDVRTMAILALGESRRPEALPHLLAFWENGPPRSLRAEVLLGISLLRLPEATGFLLGLIEEPSETAALAIEALAIHSHNNQLSERTKAAVEKAASCDLEKLFKEKFKRS